MRQIYLILLILLLSPCGFSQVLHLQGIVRDAGSNSPVAGASVLFEKKRIGLITDSTGPFSFSVSDYRSDSVSVSHVGFVTQKFFIRRGEDTVKLDVLLDPGGSATEVLIKTRVNKGLYLWRKVVSRKEEYDPFNLDNYAYREYNKIIVDVDNFNMRRIKKKFLLSPLHILINPLHEATDSAGELPAYIAECISDFARRNNPLKTHQHIEACNTKGVPLDNFNDILRSLKQKIHVFNGYVRIMDQDFMSPFNKTANLFYDFSVSDTQIIEGIKYFKLVFSPRRGGEGAFDGNALVESGTFRLKNIILHLDKRTKLNFVEDVSVTQDFVTVSDSFLFIKHERISALFNLMGNRMVKARGTLSNTYDKFIVHSDSIENMLDGQPLKETVTNESGYMDRDEKEWKNLRLESLNGEEEKTLQTINDFVEGPGYDKLRRNLKFAGTGYWEAGKVDVGKWYSLMSANQWEGLRFRIDAFTNKKFSEKWFFHNYLAYGDKDAAFKGQSEVYYVERRYPGMLRFHASWRKDVENNIMQLGGMAVDNVFSLAVQKPNSKPRFLAVRDMRFDVYKDWPSGLSVELIASHQRYTPLMNLPPIDIYSVKSGDPLTSFNIGMKIRFSYLDKYVMNDYYKYWIGTRYPAVTLVVEKGIPNILRSAYSYTRLSASVSDYFSLAPFGGISYKVYAGKIFGVVPFTFLENHPGNDIYYYGDNVFNMMYRFEYLSDQYAGFRFNHTIGPGIFRLIPFTQKLKWRQLWTFNAVWGSLSEFNKYENRADQYFKTLNGRPFMEIGTGVENIFRVLRIDCIWRLLPEALPGEDVLKFGVFGSFRLRL